MQTTDNTQDAEKTSIALNCSNKDQEEIVSVLSEIFNKQIKQKDLIKELRNEVAPYLFSGRLFKRTTRYTEHYERN